jgi:reactive chlorine resistance protein C
LRVFSETFSFCIAERTEGPRASLGLLRWALVVIFLWFGVSKFTGHKLSQFTQWVVHSPILSWLPDLFGVEGASDVIGFVELSTAAVLIAGAFNAFASALGAAMSCVTYLITLSLLLTTPGVSGSTVAGFLLKDLVLLAASLCLLLASLGKRRIQHG